MRSNRRTIRALAFTAAAACTLASARSANAFCRTTTTTAPAVLPPQKNPCWTEGVPVYHSSQCLPYRLLSRDSKVVPNAVLSETLGRAFAAWAAPNKTCTPGISAIELPPSDDAAIVGYRAGERGHNLVGVPETWTHGSGPDTLALSTLTFQAETGEIFDVDVEVNPMVSWSFSEKPPPDGYDLESALTHEVGHMLGFAHTGVSDAVMYPNYEVGSIKQRTLASDDAEAICVVYPNRATRATAAGLVQSTACNLAQSSGASSCEPNITHGCSVGPPRGPSAGAPWAIAAGGIALAIAAYARARSRR